MKVVATDDEARRNPFVWLGPVDVPLTVPARLAAVAWAVVLIPTFTFLAWVLTPFIGVLGLDPVFAFLFHAVLAIVGGAGGAIWLIRSVGKHVDPVTPLRHLVATWRDELHAPRPTGAAVTRTVTAPALWVEDDPTLTTTHTVSTRLRFDDDD